MTKKQASSDGKIAIAALQQAGKHGWTNTTLDTVAKASKIPAAALKKRFKDTNALIPLIVAHITDETLKNYDKPDKQTSVHDRLFELLMARFEQLQAHRKGIISIADSARHELRTLTILADAHYGASKSLLNKASIRLPKNLSTAGPIILAAVFLLSFRVWKNDETLDMSKTMASIDRQLRYLNQTMEMISKCYT